MSYYIESNSGAFISGLYKTKAEAQAAVQRYIQQAEKRYSNNIQQLKESLKVVRNADNAPPPYIVDELAAEIYYRIAGNSVGTIYTEPLLLGMARCRIIGIKGDYHEVTQAQRYKALTLLTKGKGAGPLKLAAETETYTRTKNPYTLAGTGKEGIYKTYLPRI